MSAVYHTDSYSFQQDYAKEKPRAGPENLDCFDAAHFAFSSFWFYNSQWLLFSIILFAEVISQPPPASLGAPPAMAAIKSVPKTNIARTLLALLRN
jgi:hypothetical protein